MVVIYYRSALAFLFVSSLWRLSSPLRARGPRLGSTELQDDLHRACLPQTALRTVDDRGGGYGGRRRGWPSRSGTTRDGWPRRGSVRRCSSRSWSPCGPATSFGHSPGRLILHAERNPELGDREARLLGPARVVEVVGRAHLHLSLAALRDAADLRGAGATPGSSLRRRATSGGVAMHHVPPRGAAADVPGIVAGRSSRSRSRSVTTSFRPSSGTPTSSAT